MFSRDSNCQPVDYKVSAITTTPLRQDTRGQVKWWSDGSVLFCSGLSSDASLMNLFFIHVNMFCIRTLTQFINKLLMHQAPTCDKAYVHNHRLICEIIRYTVTMYAAVFGKQPTHPRVRHPPLPNFSTNQTYFTRSTGLQCSQQFPLLW